MRRAAGFGFVALAFLVLTSALVPFRDSLTLSTEVLAFLLLVVAAALIGGLTPALLAAVGGFALLNYYFTPPLHSLTVSAPENLVALAIFLVIAVAVSEVVDRAERRRRESSALTALLSAAGHDLRSPLASATAAVSGLRSAGLSSSDRDELLDTAAVSLDRLERLVSDLLDLSRLRSGATVLTLEAVAPAEVVAVALDEVGEAAVAVRVALPDDLREVRADAALLTRAIVNLVVNALRYGGGPVEVTAATAGRRVGVRVTDHGPGVPPGQWSRMFRPFERLGAVEGAGVGLGLALSRGLVEAMSGTLTPSATPGGGLTMTISLRRADR